MTLPIKWKVGEHLECDLGRCLNCYRFTAAWSTAIIIRRDISPRKVLRLWLKCRDCRRVWSIEDRLPSGEDIKCNWTQTPDENVLTRILSS